MERRKDGKARRPISESPARCFSRATLSSRSASLRSRSDAHGLDRGDAAFHFIDPKALQAQQRVGPVHRALPSALPNMADSAA
jgi:hypothetical protein